MELAWWFNVGVQIFLCISGYLYGQREIGETPIYYSRRFKKILIPYYIVFIPYGILQFIFARDVFNPMSFVRGLVVNATLKGAGHLWFVSTILLCYVLTPLLATYRNSFIKDKKSIWVFALTTVGIATVFFGAFNNFYNPAWISCYIVGFVLGINERHGYIKAKVLLPFLGGLAILGNGLQVYCEYIVNVHFKGWSYFCDYSHMMLGVFLFYLMKQIFDRINLRKLDRSLSITDKYSYEIYLVHHLIILGSFSLMAITDITILNIMIIVIATCVLSVALSKLETVVRTIWS